LESELQYARSALVGSRGSYSRRNKFNHDDPSSGRDTGIADTHQLLMQASKDPSASPLLPKALLVHLRALSRANNVTVNMYDITWRLRDLCLRSNIPSFDENYIEQIFEKVIPCTIATPLDCFWEGSKLLGPEVIYKIP
jgi:patched 1